MDVQTTIMECSGAFQSVCHIHINMHGYLLISSSALQLAFAVIMMAMVVCTCLMGTITGIY